MGVNVKALLHRAKNEIVHHRLRGDRLAPVAGRVRVVLTQKRGVALDNAVHEELRRRETDIFAVLEIIPCPKHCPEILFDILHGVERVAKTAGEEKLPSLVKQLIALGSHIVVVTAVKNRLKAYGDAVCKGDVLIVFDGNRVFFGGHRLKNVPHKPHRGRLLEPARRPPVGIAHDAGLGRLVMHLVRVYHVQNHGVYPAGVVVGCDHDDGPVGADAVKELCRRPTFPENAVVVAAAENYLILRVSMRILGNLLKIGGGVRLMAERDAENHLARTAYVRVTLNHSGNDKAGLFKNGRAVIHKLPHVRKLAHGEKHSVLHSHGVRDAPA